MGVTGDSFEFSPRRRSVASVTRSVREHIEQVSNIAQ
jgi:hypothetical protein